MTHVVVATGVRREAACLKALSGVMAIPGGGDAKALRLRLEEAVVGASGIASFGMAGALDPELRIGDWIVADRLHGVVETECDPAWRDTLVRMLPEARVGGVFADGRMITTVADKHALHRRTGALAVDMESHVAAAIAAERGLPFAIVRCVSDAADRALPPAVALAMRPDGGVDAAAVIRSIAARPGQIAALVTTGWGFFRAMRSLRRGGAALGERLSLP